MKLQERQRESGQHEISKPPNPEPEKMPRDDVEYAKAEDGQHVVATAMRLFFVLFFATSGTMFFMLHVLHNEI